MKKKIFNIAIILMFVITLFGYNVVSDGDSSQSSIGSSGAMAYYPNENTPFTVYGAKLYDDGVRFDSKRNAWFMPFRFDWYQAKRGEYFGESGFDEDSYNPLLVELYISEQGIVPGSGNMFNPGGWHVEDTSGGQSFRDEATSICGLVLSGFPYVGLAFSTGIALADALDIHTSDQSDYDHKWFGRHIKEASGFFEYDCYIPPNQDFDIQWILEIEWNSIDRGLFDQDPMIIGYEGTSPSAPSPKIELSPDNYDFGEVDVGESKSKSFNLKNSGNIDVDVDVFLKNGPISYYEITSGGGSYNLAVNEEKTINVKFAPDYDGESYIELWAESTQNVCEKSYINGEGNDAVDPDPDPDPEPIPIVIEQTWVNPIQVNTNDTVTFSATATGGSGEIYIYDFWFGDGTHEDTFDNTTTHTYTEAGTYNAYVTVYDYYNQGNYDSADFEILTVTAQSQPGPV